MKEKNKELKKGFALIELLVVILIIGILAAVALPQYKMAVAKSRYATIMDLAKSIADSEERYFMVYGAYTNNFNNLDIDMPQDYNSKATSEYCYNWGGCNISTNGAIYCYETYSKTKFTVYLQNNNNTSLRNKIFCDALNYDVNNFSNRLCKQITGKNTPHHTHMQRICGKELPGYSYQFSSY